MTAIIADTSREPSIDPAALRTEAKANDPTPPPLNDLPSMSPQAEAELVGHVRTLFLRAREKRRPLVAQWNKNYKVLHGRRTWGEGRAGWKPAPEVPEIFPIVDALVSWVTDQQPTFDVAPSVSPLNPWYGRMSAMAEDLLTTVQSTWHVDRFDPEIEKVVWDGMTYGIGWLKSTWDGSAYRGQGNAVMRRRDPYAIYPDPDATSIDTMNHIFDAATISKQEMERRWPGSIARLNGNVGFEDTDAQPNVLDTTGSGSAPRANPGAISPGTSPRYGLPGQDGRVQVNDDPGVTVIEAWLRTPATNENGTKYDSWRCVVVAGNRVLLDEMAEDLWSHGGHPFDRYVCIETGEFYGDSMVEKLAPMQNSINKLLAAIEHNIWLIGNPVLLEDSRAGLSRTAMTNKPGNRLSKNAQGTVEWMQPPPMQPGIATDLIKFYTDQMERISGLSAVVRGATPSGRNAQGVVDSVQEAAFVRIRKALRNLSFTIGAAGEKVASMIVEFYDTPRIVSLVGPSGEQSSRELQADHFYLPGPSGRVPMRFQLLIDAGEATSQSRGQRIAEADALFAMGAIDDEALLEIHSFPHWQQVVQRQRELKAQQGTLGQPPTQRAAARR